MSSPRLEGREEGVRVEEGREVEVEEGWGVQVVGVGVRWVEDQEWERQGCHPTQEMTSC